MNGSDINDIGSSFGAILKTLRLKHNYTQEWVAGRLGIKQAQLSKLERGLKEFSISQVIAYAAIFGFDSNIIIVFVMIGLQRKDGTIKEFIEQVKNRHPKKVISAEKREKEQAKMLQHIELFHKESEDELRKFLQIIGLFDKK